MESDFHLLYSVKYNTEMLGSVQRCRKSSNTVSSLCFIQERYSLHHKTTCKLNIFTTEHIFFSLKSQSILHRQSERLFTALKLNTTLLSGRFNPAQTVGESASFSAHKLFFETLDVHFPIYIIQSKPARTPNSVVRACAVRHILRHVAQQLWNKNCTWNQSILGHEMSQITVYNGDSRNSV